MPGFSCSVVYVGDVNGWTPQGVSSVDITQDNPLLAAQRRVLAAEFPRRRFATALTITAGGLRSDSGAYWEGRDRPAGIAQLARLQAAHKLGIVGASHQALRTPDESKPFDQVGTWVTIRMSFSRGPGGSGSSYVGVGALGDVGDRNLDALVDAARETIKMLVEVAPVADVSEHWTEMRGDLPGRASANTGDA